MQMPQAGDQTPDDENLPARRDRSGRYDDALRAAQRAAAVPAGDAVARIVAEQNQQIAKLMSGHQLAATEAVNRMFAEQQAKIAKLVSVPLPVVTPPAAEAINGMVAEQNAKFAKLVAGPVVTMQLPAVESINRMFAAKNAEIAKLASASVFRIKLPAVEGVNRLFAAQYDTLVEHLDDPLPHSTESIAEALEDLGDALADAEREVAGPVTREAASEQLGGEFVDEFATTLDAFIAVGLASKDLVVNTTVLAWLIVVRQVDRVWGRKAARQALAIFVTVAVTFALTAWTVMDDQPLSVAVIGAVGTPLSVLMTIWGRLDGE
jgi:hypothetical protein